VQLTNVFLSRHGYWNPPTARLWSLNVEEQFYLIWPLVIAATPRKMLPVVLSCIQFTKRLTPEGVPTQLVVISSEQDHTEFAKMKKLTALTNIYWLNGYVTDRPLMRRWLSAAKVYVAASRTEGMPVVATRGKGLRPSDYCERCSRPAEHSCRRGRYQEG
jgi:hypothetical protein